LAAGESFTNDTNSRLNCCIPALRIARSVATRTFCSGLSASVPARPCALLSLRLSSRSRHRHAKNQTRHPSGLHTAARISRNQRDRIPSRALAAPRRAVAPSRIRRDSPRSNTQITCQQSGDDLSGQRRAATASEGVGSIALLRPILSKRA
jgi:hypothetical protein